MILEITHPTKPKNRSDLRRHSFACAGRNNSVSQGDANITSHDDDLQSVQIDSKPQTLMIHCQLCESGEAKQEKVATLANKPVEGGWKIPKGKNGIIRQLSMIEIYQTMATVEDICAPFVLSLVTVVDFRASFSVTQAIDSRFGGSLQRASGTLPPGFFPLRRSLETYPLGFCPCGKFVA